MNKSFVVFDDTVFAEKSFCLRLWKCYSRSLILTYYSLSWYEYLCLKSKSLLANEDMVSTLAPDMFIK